MLAFKYKISFFNIIKNTKIIIIFFAKFFNVMPTIKKKGIIGTLNIKILNLKTKFAILNKFAIVSQLN